MDEEVVLKGVREGLLLVVNSDIKFSNVLSILQKKLESAGDFFVNSPSPLTVGYKGKKKLTESETKKLVALLEKFGLTYDDSVPKETNGEVKEEKTVTQKTTTYTTPEDAVEKPALILYRTMRGGQELRYKGSVVVVGDINPTARIFAENDIIVTGTAKGILHAGALGDKTAKVLAGKFNGGQIRIAEYIVHVPSDQEEPDGIERAQIKDGQIVIDTIHR